MAFSKWLTQDGASQTELDLITKASASTYTDEFLAKNGYKISLNLSYLKTQRFIENKSGTKIYPSIVVWKPYEGSSGFGEVKIIEFIETEETYFLSWLRSKWHNFADDIYVQLIVPPNKVSEALIATGGKKIHVQSYVKTPEGTYLFKDEN